MLTFWLLACTPKDSTTDDADSGPDPSSDSSSDSGSEDCDTPGAVEFTPSAVDAWHWEGEANPTLSVAYRVVSPACDGFVVETDAAWLGARPLKDADVLTLDADAASLPSGAHTATVTVRDGTRGVAATLTVTLRTLHEPTGRSVRHALVIGVDGLDGEELERIATPTLDVLRRHALWTDRAKTQLTADALSGPGWTSLLTGVEADVHGVTSNGDYGARDPAYPSFLARLTNAGIPAAGAFEWPDLLQIVEPDSYEEAVVGDLSAVTEGMDVLLREGDERLYVANLHGVDDAGHASGYSADNPAYTEAIANAEASIDRFLIAVTDRPDIAEEEWIVVLTADHGGVGTEDGGRTEATQTIPLIVAGAGIPPGRIGTGSQLDLHPTLLRYFGLDPSAWGLEGTVRLEPLEDLCDDGVDGDGDGAVDCADSECAGAPECRTCDTVDLGSATGAQVWSGPLATSEWEGTCGGSSGAEQLFTYTAAVTGDHVFSAEGLDMDTSVYVLDGCGGAELACANDVPGLGGGRAAISTAMTAGQIVTVVLDSTADIGTSAVLAVLSPPVTCPDATLEAGPGTTSGSLPVPTTGVQGDCATVFGPVLYAWTAPSAGTWTFDTIGSSGDTVLYVLDGCGGATITCNDDASDLQSLVNADLAEGQAVILAVGSFAGTTSTYTLNITAP